MFKITAIAFVISLTLGIGSCNPASNEASRPIRIAAVGPLTGAQAETGQDMINGIRLSVDEWNAKGGVLGKKIELVVFDDAADPKEAVSVARKIESDPTIVGIVGHLNSGTTKPASTVYHEAGLPVIIPAATNPEITKQGFSNLFRIAPTDLDQGTDVARFALNNLGKKRFAIIHDSSAYGQPLAEIVRKTVEEAHAEVVTFDGITEGEKDFRALLTRIRQSAPDVIFFGGIYNEGGLLAKQGRELGLNIPLLAADGAFSDKFIQIAGPAAEGVVMSFIAPDEKTNAATISFATKFRERYGAIKAFAPLGYDAGNVLLTALESAGRPDKAAIISALHSPTFRYEGVTGESVFDSDGNNSRRNVFFFVIRKGKFESIPK